MEHEWNLPATDDGFPRVLRVAEGEPTGDNPEGLLEISGNCSWEDEHLAAEILHLAEQKRKLRGLLAEAEGHFAQEVHGGTMGEAAEAELWLLRVRDLLKEE